MTPPQYGNAVFLACIWNSREPMGKISLLNLILGVASPLRHHLVIKFGHLVATVPRGEKFLLNSWV
jgi:hypothetical protein